MQRTYKYIKTFTGNTILYILLLAFTGSHTSGQQLYLIILLIQQFHTKLRQNSKVSTVQLVINDMSDQPNGSETCSVGMKDYEKVSLISCIFNKNP